MTISAEDLYGNLTPAFTSSYTIALKSNPGSGTLNGTLTENASAGVAAFSGLTLDQAADGQPFQATTTGLLPRLPPLPLTSRARCRLASNWFALTQPPRKHGGRQPLRLTVSAEDSTEIDPAFTSGSVTIALKSNPATALSMVLSR